MTGENTERMEEAEDWQWTVEAWHGKFGAPFELSPTDIPADRIDLRHDLHMEEAWEFYEAALDGDLVGVADALGDLLWVVFGTAVEYGIDMVPVFEEIARSNFSKLGEDGKPVLRADGKILKGPNFFEPDLKTVLEDQGWTDTKEKKSE